MFDITSADISELNDTDLRELVGRLCEAELATRGLSPAAVTWGGSQTAADGGLDVRVALPPGGAIEGFIPRPSTGFQVKKPDMRRRAVLSEMRPAGEIRPVIQELANDAGAYIIVSSHGSTADIALHHRREAMREALKGVANIDRLHTDFYDRTRLAAWVRRHPGLTTWVKERIGRAFPGWRPYGPWSGGPDGVDAEYLLDDRLRVRFDRHRNSRAQSAASAIDELRDELAPPRKIVRLVGLSGVGKTRFIQALFDRRVGSRPLPPSLAVYTNLSDNPDPQPTGLASDLIANRTRAVLIVDNCPPDLHRSLSDLCSGQSSTVSVLTVEYDIREDQPEATQVVILDTSSPELIERLVRHRYSHVSEVDARTIADASGGNARIAIALAETVGRSESIAGLSNEELFERLFRQRHDPDNALLLAAQACSLVYSFEGEALDGQEAELPRLAAMIGQPPAELYRHVGELLRRDLMQQRGAWRAVLPNAIANRLAARALEDTPYDLINQHFIAGGTKRLARSFSRRLSFLHDHPKAVGIVERWLAPDGLLGDVTTLNDLGRAMFENVAPVLPEAALAALERAGNRGPGIATMVWRRRLSLLRSLAYDPQLFERSVDLLVTVSTQSTDEAEAKTASEIFVSLFPIYLSGTHATIEQRLHVIERLLRAGEVKSRAMGLAALERALEAAHFASSHPFEFGARSRDYGYQPRSNADVTRWYNAALALIDRLAVTEGKLNPELRRLVANRFRGLWAEAHMYDELERLSRMFAKDGFWREGWIACRQTMRYDRDQLAPEVASRLSALEIDLRPSSLPDRVRALVLGDRFSAFDLDDTDADGNLTSTFERLAATARQLGVSVAADAAAFAELLPDLLRGGNMAYVFGRGLGTASLDVRATWAKLVDGLEQIAPEERNVDVLTGFLAQVWEQDRDLAQQLLDSALTQPALLVFLPVLQMALELDDHGVARLKRALGTGQVSVQMCRNLAFGRNADHLTGHILKDLLMVIVDRPDGFDVAIEILFMALNSDRSAQRTREPSLLEAGRDLLSRVTFRKGNYHDDHHMADVVKSCLTGADGSPVAAEIALRLRQAVAADQTYSFRNDRLLAALLETQPMAVLDALFAGDEKDQRAALATFEHTEDLGGNPAKAISCESLVAWCEGDPKHRYPLAASIVTFARRSEASGPLIWSDQARALLTNAPDCRSVLEVFIKRFRPRRWNGSRAALMEANGRLLDSLASDVPSPPMPFVNEAKAQLAREVARQRQWETELDRARDERFEW